MKNNYLVSAITVLLIIFSCSSDSEEPTPEPDTVAPTVNFGIAGFSSSGSEPIVASNQIEININAQDAGGIAKVEAFIDDQKVGEDTTAPYQITIDISGFTSKIAQTTKFKDYTLKIVVTDTSGNVSSKEQVINIDNELPVISEVSLEAGTVIGGDNNTVTFNAVDNEGLKSVKTYLNNELLIEIADSNYDINIDTQQLEDGENTLKIEAIDLAENTATFEIEFVVDNTGPEINVPNLIEGQILDETFLFSPEVHDEFSDIASFVAKLNDVTILESTSNETGEYEINPENLEVGDASFEIVAIDNLGNETMLNLSNQVLRKLFEIQLENGFFENSWFGFHILISEMDGSFIELKTADFNDESITVYAPGEFAIDKEYMVSFIADENQGNWIKTHMTVVQNLTRSNFHQIQFSPALGESINQQTIPMSGFEGIENIIGRGHGFMSTHDSNVTEFNIELNEGNGYAQYNSLFLIGYALGDNPGYGYLKIDNPWSMDFVIDKSDFVFDNIAQGTASYAGNTLPINNRDLYIWGFEKSEDVEKNLSHLIHDSGHTFGLIGSESYNYPTVFEEYKHHMRLDNYNTYRDGLPASDYLIPDWSIDHVQNGNEVSVIKTGIGPTVGRLIVEIGSPNDSQLMALLFDSSKEGPIFIPQLPEELSSLNIYDTFQNQSYSVDYSELISFETITTYSDYLNEVISKYKEHTEVSPVMESLTNTNAFIFNNWSFKYQ